MKKIRNAVRGFLIENDKVLAIKYTENKCGLYDVPGGKIEENETNIEAVIREFKEESGLEIKNPLYKGKIRLEYEHIIFMFDVFLIDKYSGKIQDSKDNTTEWINIKDLMNNKTVANLLPLESHFINNLLIDNRTFNMNIEAFNDETIKKFDYSIVE